MSLNTAEIVRCIDGVLAPYGFLRQRQRTWYKRFKETIVVFDLQKEFGSQHFVNLAIAVNALLTTDFPLEQHCHLRVRLNHLIENANDLFPELDLENKSVDHTRRFQRIAELTTLGAEWLFKFSTTEALATALRANRSLRNRSIIKLKEYLHIPPDD